MQEGRGMIEINMKIYNIISEYDGVTFISKDGSKMKILLNKDEWEMLQIAANEQV
jgi:hypothetical protein